MFNTRMASKLVESREELLGCIYALSAWRECLREIAGLSEIRRQGTCCRLRVCANSCHFSSYELFVLTV
jgi:hypothetical protein